MAETPDVRAALPRLADLIAEHDEYAVTDAGWTVCLCGHVTAGDDGEGSHARHVAEVALSAGWQLVPPGSVVVPAGDVAGAYSIGSTVWPGLGKSVEEAGELLQVLGKLIANRGHAKHWDGTDLHVRAVDEIGDVLAALQFLARMNDLPELAVEARADMKYTQFLRWQIEHSREATPAPEPGEAR